MNIVIIGRGWIGQKMARALSTHNLKVVSHKDAFHYLDAYVPRPVIDWVVNCAGVTGNPNVDSCEASKSETILANTVFPIQLMENCMKWKSRLMHFSSGCIFEGGPFSEHDVPNFDSSTYSASKLVSDQALIKNAVVLRVRMPFDGTYSPKNLLVKLSNYARRSKILDGHNSITNVDEAVEMACDLIESNASNGPYHLVNEGPIWTHEIMELMGIDATYWDVQAFRETFPAVRSECILSSKTPLSNTRTSIQRAIENMKTSIAV